MLFEKLDIEHKDLEVGTMYNVIGEDCCVGMQFVSRIQEIENPGEYPTVVFENGVAAWGHAIKFYRMKLSSV